MPSDGDRCSRACSKSPTLGETGLAVLIVLIAASGASLGLGVDYFLSVAWLSFRAARSRQARDWKGNTWKGSRISGALVRYLYGEPSWP